MRKLFRITGISKNDAYRNDKFLIGDIGTFEFMHASEKGYFGGTFTKVYRNPKDKEKYHNHTFYAVKIVEVIPEPEG
jgi:hypothetical protein